MTRLADAAGVASFAGTPYAAGRRWARTAVGVSIVAGSVQLSRDGQVIRVHPVRRDRSRELGAFADPRDGPAARTPPSATPPDPAKASHQIKGRFAAHRQASRLRRHPPTP